MQNYFELFDLETSFFVDDEALKKAYQDQVTRFHPDNFATKNIKYKVDRKELLSRLMF